MLSLGWFVKVAFLEVGVRIDLIPKTTVLFDTNIQIHSVAP